MNVLQIYSICNLHDVSWGNRPSVNQGTNMLSHHAEKQAKLKENYKVFRGHFLIFWILANYVFAFFMEASLSIQ